MSAAAFVAPSVTPPPNCKPKSYHAYNFLAVFNPKYGKKPKFVPIYLENCVKQPPVFSSYGNSMPVLYRLVDVKNGIDTLVEIKLRTPVMKSVWGISAGPKKQEEKDKKPRFTLSLSYDQHTAEGAAYFELRKDLDDLAVSWAAEDGGRWYSNVPNEIKMGAVTVSKGDYIAGMFMGVTRARVTTDKTTGEQRTYAPQENHAVKQKAGKFPVFCAFDSIGAPIDPLTITRDAVVQSLSLTKGLYFMPKQWGWSIELVQAQKLADGVLTECVMGSDDDEFIPVSNAHQAEPVEKPASAFEQDGFMSDGN